MAHSRRAHGAFFNEMRLQRAMRAMALRASSAPFMRQTVHPGNLWCCSENIFSLFFSLFWFKKK